MKPYYIVLRMKDDAAHSRILDKVRADIGEDVRYIDIAPEVSQDGDEKNVNWLKVNL